MVIPEILQGIERLQKDNVIYRYGFKKNKIK